jgi:nitrate/nitrite-specific signal transduction histidine kinase
MPNRSTDALFQLIKSLEKSEKRNFKLYAKRNSSSDELKVVKLFDALDKMETYDADQEQVDKKTAALQHEGASLPPDLIEFKADQG